MPVSKKILSFEVFTKIRKDCGLGMSVRALALKFALPEEGIKLIITAPSFEHACSSYERIMDWHSKSNEIKDFKPDSSKGQAKISKRDLQIIDLRRGGLTLDEIGKRYELSRERVRQILSKYAKNEKFITPSEVKAKVRTNELKAIRIEITANWRMYKGFTVSELAEEYKISESDILKCVNKVQYAYLRGNQESHIAQTWTKESCINVLRNAATFSFPLTVLEYRKLLNSKTIEGPTLPIFISRFGSWMEACRAAGVETGNPVREYDTNWSDTDLLLMVRRFMWETRDAGWTIENYSKWRIEQDPVVASVGILRLRLGQWSDLRVLALDYHAPEFNMSIFETMENHEE